MLNNTNKKSLKGFTLIELIVVIAIIGVLSCILVPNIMAYIKKAKCTAAIADASTIIKGVQSSLADIYITQGLQLEVNGDIKTVTIDGKASTVGAFTSYSYYNATHSGTQPAKIDLSIANALSEITANANLVSNLLKNPMPYNTTTKNCRQYLKDTGSNFGIVIVYDSGGEVIFMQFYHNNILVTYAFGEYVANPEKDARFIGTNTWATAFTDAGIKSKDIDNDKIKKARLSKWW